MSEYTNSSNFNYDGELVSFNYKTDLLMSEMVQFVNDVVSVSVVDNFYPFLAELAFNSELVDKFTDIDMRDYIEGQLVDDYDRFFKESDIIEVIKGSVNPATLNTLYTSVAQALEYKTGIHPNRFEDALVDLIDIIGEKIEGFDFGNMGELSNLIKEANGKLTVENVLDAYEKKMIPSPKE